MSQPLPFPIAPPPRRGRPPGSKRHAEPAAPAVEPGALLTVMEVTALLPVGRSTVYKLIKRGKVEPVYFGRAVFIRRSEIEALVARGGVRW